MSNASKYWIGKCKFVVNKMYEIIKYISMLVKY